MLRRSSSIVRYRPSSVLAPQIAYTSCRSSIHTSSIAQKSATEVVKENLEKLNKKIGQVAAEGIEKTQEASHRASEKAEHVMGHAEQQANKTGANINDKAEATKDKAKDKAKETAEDFKKKVDN